MGVPIHSHRSQPASIAARKKTFEPIARLDLVCCSRCRSDESIRTGMAAHVLLESALKLVWTMMKERHPPATNDDSLTETFSALGGERPACLPTSKAARGPTTFKSSRNTAHRFTIDGGVRSRASSAGIVARPTIKRIIAITAIEYVIAFAAN